VLVESDKVVTSVSEVLTRIVVLRVFNKVLTDSSSHGKTTIRIDVNLADSALDSLADLVLGDTDGVLNLTTELVDGLYVLLRDRGRTVENDGEARDTLLNFVKDIKTKVGLCARRELDNTVAGTDGDSKGIDTSALDEVNDLIGVGVVAGLRLDIILDTSKDTELTLDGNVVLMSVFDDLLGESDVLLIRKSRAIDHDIAETAGNAINTELITVTMVKVKSNRNTLVFRIDFLGIFNSTLSHVTQKSLVSISTSTTRNLKDNRALCLNTSSDDSLHLLHVVEVESRDSKALLHSMSEHLLGVNKTKILIRNCLTCHCKLFQQISTAISSRIQFTFN
jgi:hypothetical protein